MRIIGSMVTRNEASRYLAAVLRWHSSFLDAICVYDDGSDDDTIDICRDFGCYVAERPDHIASFIDHEGLFRQAAYGFMERVAQPEEGDWILALDADEMLCTTQGWNPRPVIEQAFDAIPGDITAMVIPVPEIFKVEEDDGLITAAWQRIDGFWATIAGTRLYRWQPDGLFRDAPMGSGSEPLYVAPPFVQMRELALLHFGYAYREDQQEKYQRYSMRNNNGHNFNHIESILQPPVLRSWDGQIPPLWRGPKTPTII